MADYISQIKLPNNTTYDFRDKNLKVYTGSCTTAAGTAIKEVTTDGAFTLTKGAVVFVTFTNTNTAAVGDLKLRVNSDEANDAKPIKYLVNSNDPANIPAKGYLRANQTYMFRYDGTNWVADLNYYTYSNDFASRVGHYNNILARKAITAESLIVGDATGYEKVAANVTFDLAYPIVWCTAAVAANASNYANMFLQHYDRNIATGAKSGFTSSANKVIYLIVTISNNIATIDSDIITDTLPSTEDGKVYISLGKLGTQSTGANFFFLYPVHPMFWYKNGGIQEYGGTSEYAIAAPLAGITGADNLKAIEALSGTTGLLKKTAANTWTLDTTSYATSEHTHNYLSMRDNIRNTSNDTYAGALSKYFSENYSTIPRGSLINFYSTTKGHGSEAFGYWIAGYNDSPYGGFFVAHYNDPRYVGINQGVYTEYKLAKINTTIVDEHILVASGTDGDIKTSGITIDDTNIITANASGHSFSNIKFYTVNASAGGASKNMWVKFAKIDLNNSNHFGNIICDIFLSRSYNSPSPETYSIRVMVGWTTPFIYQLGSAVGGQIIDQFRVVQDTTNHQAYFEYHVAENASSNNTTYIRIIKYSGSDLTLMNQIQTEEDSAFSRKASINLSSGAIVIGAGKITATEYTGNAVTATTATNLSAKPVLATSGDNITVTAGGKTSDAFTVPYASKTTAANLTTTTNAIAYYTDTIGTFSSKASADGALYATSTNGSLQWGTLPIAQGGTGKTTANDAANALISGLPTWTASPTADTYFIRRDTNGTATFGQVKFSSIAKITDGVITLGPYSITPVTSVNGHTGSSVNVTAGDLGLSSALRYQGTTTTTMEDGLTTAAVTIGGNSFTPTQGDVVIYNDAEYVWTGSLWELLGAESSFKKVQTAVNSSNASGNSATTFISSVTQDTQGVITVQTSTLNTSGTWSGTATTATKLSNTAQIGAADRPVYFTNGGVPSATTYRMAATNVTKTNTMAIQSSNGSNELETGIWYVNGTSSIFGQSDGAAIINKYSDSWVSQIYQDYRTGQIALRGKNNGTWQDWRQVLDSNNYTDYLTTAKVQSLLSISSSGSTTKWLNEQGGWTTPTASDIGAAPAVDGGYLPLSGGVMATSSLITIGTNGTHRGIKAGNTYINSINGDLIFQNNGAIRFGTDAWDYNEWAGLKYDHSVKTVYLGLADKNYLKANAAQTNGTTHLVNMRYLYMNTKQILDTNLAIDNTTFKNTLLLFINQSNESTTTAFDATKSSWGIGFQRQWNSGTLGQIAAGIYAYGISNWRTGLVFRTKTGTDSASSHDTNALILNHNGDATFIGNVTASDFTGNLNGNATTATTSTYIQGIDQGTSNINIANTITSLGEGKIRYDYRIGKDSTGLFAHSTESNTNAILTFSTASGANYMHQLGFSTDEHLYHRAFIGVAQTNDKAWNEILDSSNYTDYAAAADHTHNYAGSSSTGGAATTVTTANSNAALYLVGVASDATTSLKYNSDIIMDDGTLSLTNIQMSGDTSAITRKIPAWTGGWARQLINVTANDGTALMSASIYGNAQALSYIYIGTAAHNSTDNIRLYTGGKIMAKEFQGDLTGHATSATSLTDFVISTYTIAAGKGVRIQYPTQAPVLISAQRSNTGGRLILLGGGYGAGATTRNDFTEVVSSNTNSFTWSLPVSDSITNSIEIMNVNSAGTANVVVWSKSSCTFSEITALTSEATNRKLLHSSNYTDYTVTKTGDGASGTWGISISGNADSATTATNLASVPTLSAAGTATINLSANTTYTLTVGGKSVIFKTPTDNNNYVSQSSSTTANWRKILLHYKDDAASTTAVTSSTNVVYAAVGVSVQPSTGTIRAGAYNILDKVKLEYNTTDDSLDFIFI